eukprot:tig00000950_g5764.t1
MEEPARTVVFSDIDGTLAFYPEQFDGAGELTSSQDGRPAYKDFATGRTLPCKALPTSTSKAAYISERTIELVRALQARGVLFVLVTAVRISTFLARKPLLPPAHYACIENGGRIFKYNDATDAGSAYEEDEEWAAALAPHTGGAPGAEGEARGGTLWDFHRGALAAGWKTDHKSYTADFRVDLGANPGRTPADLDALRREAAERGIASSHNLGKCDFYPKQSGKANAVLYLMRKLGVDPESCHACFDDDNDVEMGEVVGRGWLTGCTGAGIEEALRRNPRWRLSPARGPPAIEGVLEEILASLPPPPAPHAAAS